MERQSERRREPEPTVYVPYIEQFWLHYKMLQEKAASRPHVLRAKDWPWTQNAMAFLRRYVGSLPNERYASAPLGSFNLAEQILAPGGRSGKHRHFNEAVLYVVEGDGWVIHDGIKLPFEAGDVVCVPTYTVHERSNASGDRPVRVFFSTAVPLCEILGIETIEQVELHPSYRIPEGAQPLYGNHGEFLGYRNADGVEYRFAERDLKMEQRMQAREAASFSGPSKNTYDWYRQTLAEQLRWRQSVPQVIRAKDRHWEDTPMGRIKYLVHPTIPSGLLLFDVFVQELPPGGSSGQHRHVSEEVHRILEGRGYDTHDGVRWEWEKEDVVCIPPHIVHKHSNADPNHAAVFVGFQSRLYYYMGHGGIEHLEDAPGYKG